MSMAMAQASVHNRNGNGRVLAMLSNPKIAVYTSDYVVQIISRQSLVKFQEFMRNNKGLTVTGFLRFFRQLLPIDQAQTNQEIQFMLHLALFKLFSEICLNKKKTQVNFSDISTYISQKMPNLTQQSIIQQKLLPLGLNISESHKKHIIPPQIYGQIQDDQCYLTKRPIRSDRIQHLNREVGQSQYSHKFGLYFSIDRPSVVISVYDQNFYQVMRLQTEKDMPKRDMVVTYIAWSDWEEKIACILGNYSISMWSKDDNYKYQVNVPLPAQYLGNPFVMIKYMDSMRKWITIDNRPAFYVLNNKNYEPEFMFLNPKIRKIKETEKMHICQLHYVQLLCVAFQRNLFLISLKNKEIVSEVHSFRTSITSIVFSESFQALFVSTYESFFRSYELSQYQDLMERVKFQGHKSQISLLGVIEKKPIVFSLQDNSILKMFDMRSSTCYHSMSVLKNIIYKQVLYLHEAICLVGSKMHVYGIEKQLTYKEQQRLIHLGTMYKDLLVITNKNARIYDIRTGALKSVIKHVFEHSQTSNDIYSVFSMPTKQLLFLHNEQGQCSILQTKQMSEVHTAKLPPKPTNTMYLQQADLMIQSSIGNIRIDKYNKETHSRQKRRQIINQSDIVRFVKISIQHDIIVVAYEAEDQVYFYGFEKGKVIGYLGFGTRAVVKFKNMYKPHVIIHRIVDILFYDNKNEIVVLLSDQVQILTYNRSGVSMSFLLKKQIRLWENPLDLTDNTTYIYPTLQKQIPLYSTSLSQFNNSTLTITSNNVNILTCIDISLQQIPGVETYNINKQNYNPSRIGTEVHIGIAQLKNPMVVIRDLSSLHHVQRNYVYNSKLGVFCVAEKLGNLLAVGDQGLLVGIWQAENWGQIAAIVHSRESLPRMWNIFKYSEQEIKEVEFILDFLENQEKVPVNNAVKSLMESGIKVESPQHSQNTKITISQLIKQDRQNGGQKSYRSCSLRERKIVMEKERDEKQKQQYYMEQQTNEKQKPNNAINLKNNAQKQINDVLGYLSINHNETILKKGIIDEDPPEVRALQRKLIDSITITEKKSLLSFKTGDQSLKSQNKLVGYTGNSVSLAKLKVPKTISTNMYGHMTSKLGLKTFNSKKLINDLKVQRSTSQRSKVKSAVKIERLPNIFQI